MSNHPERFLEDRPRVKGFCTWCGEKVKPPRRFWCSDTHVYEWRIRRDPSFLREEVYRRDQGVCAECGLDTKPVDGKLKQLRKSVLKLHWGKKPEEALRLALVFWDLAAKFNYKLPKGKDPVQVLIRYRSKSLWEADHIVPVYEGGGACGLEGLQSLCKVCHGTRTKQQATHRAAKRKQEKANGTKDPPAKKAKGRGRRKNS